MSEPSDLLRELDGLSGRPALEKRLDEASGAVRAALWKLAEVERELGERVWEIEERAMRRARMRPWLWTLLDVLGAVPFADPDEPRLEGARRSVDEARALVLALRGELARFGDVDRRVDALAKRANADGSTGVAAPSLVDLGVQALACEERLAELEESRDALALAQSAASAAAISLAEAEALAERQVTNFADDPLHLILKKLKALEDARFLLATATAGFARSGVAVDGALSSLRASGAVPQSSFLGGDPSFVETYESLVAPIEGAQAHTGVAFGEAEDGAAALGRAITLTAETLAAARRTRDDYLLELRERASP